jgi:ribonucleoside-diphosphate reductase alpha chain
MSAASPRLLTLIDQPDIKVRKRDGRTLQEFDVRKVQRAINKAFADVGQTANGDFKDLVLAIVDETAQNTQDGVIDVEAIQGIVKKKLMELGYHKVAESYIIYANKRDELRKHRARPDTMVVADLINQTRYAKWIEDWKRREIWPETTDRSRQMHIKNFPQIADRINWAFGFVDDKKVLPSMRSMQFGGAAISDHNAKGYNCSYSVCNRLEFFSEAFYLLLCGTGVGYSVQWRHTEQLPEIGIMNDKIVKHVVLDDKIESWADSIYDLLWAAVKGYYVEFAYHKIRDAGKRLKTSGGRAPGHLPLKKAHERIRSLLLQAQGRKLEPIECYDIVCLFADAVYAGGIREAATICLFSLDDPAMMHAKTSNDWHKTHPWRARSNNSVVLVRGEVTKEQFKRVFKATKRWGEPGFFFTDDPDYGANPCVEIGLNPKLAITPQAKIELENWAKATSRKLPKLKVGDVYWGWQMCNLTEVNCAKSTSPEEFYEQVKAAAIIGTCQAAYTNFPYLGWVSEAICKREALLGVSLTGIMDRPDIALNPEVQRTAAQLAVETNIEVAGILGINPAARVTCVKPSGTASLVVGAVGSGIHPHHARRYFRRIRMNPGDPAYQYFKSINPHMCTTISPTKELVTFPIMAPDGALTRHDFTAVEFLDKVKLTMDNWVLPGTARPGSSPNLNHNVSNTITVKDNEWDEVSEYLWKNRKYFTGVSMLGDFGDKGYENAPREEVVNEADEAKWQMLIKDYKPIDWTQFVEDDDNTAAAGESACAGGACALGY